MNKPMPFFNRLINFLNGKPTNREQLIDTIRTAEQHKIVDSESEGMLEGVLQVSEMQIRDIMIPHSQMISVHIQQNLPEIIATVIETKHSRYPVLNMQQTEVIGILLAKDLLNFTAEESDKFNIKKIVQPAMIVPETQHLDKLLKQFKRRRSHMAIVIDEFGHIAGLITMEDILEQIVGDIEDESDFEEEDAIKQYDDYFVIKADLPLEEFDEYFNVEFDQEDCESIGGLVIKHLGYIPKRNDEFIYNNFKFKILHADKRRIRLIQLETINP